MCEALDFIPRIAKEKEKTKQGREYPRWKPQASTPESEVKSHPSAVFYLLESSQEV
jgi:hypothetical protein